MSPPIFIKAGDVTLNACHISACYWDRGSTYTTFVVRMMDGFEHRFRSGQGIHDAYALESRIRAQGAPAKEPGE